MLNQHITKKTHKNFLSLFFVVYLIWNLYSTPPTCVLFHDSFMISFPVMWIYNASEWKRSLLKYISVVEVISWKKSGPKAGWTWAEIEKRVSEEHTGTAGKEAGISVGDWLAYELLVEQFLSCSVVGISTGNAVCSKTKIFSFFFFLPFCFPPKCQENKGKRCDSNPGRLISSGCRSNGVLSFSFPLQIL